MQEYRYGSIYIDRYLYICAANKQEVELVIVKSVILGARSLWVELPLYDATKIISNGKKQDEETCISVAG